MITEFEVLRTVFGIVILVASGKLLGILFSKLRISEIIGYIIVGIVLGPFAIGGLIPLFGGPLIELNDLMTAFWQISGIIILFSAGMHFTFDDLRHAGIRSTVIGAFGVLVPLLLGYVISLALGLSWEAAMVVGIALSATSITVSVTILKELGKEKTKEGNIMVHAAVLDDIFSLAGVSAISSIVIAHSLPELSSIAIVTAKAVGFWFLILIIAVLFLPKLISIITSKFNSEGITNVTAVGTAFGFATAALLAGLNPIVGSFAAGMGLASSKIVSKIHGFVDHLVIIAAPLFFIIIGAHIDPSKIIEINIIIFGLILVVAIFSKIAGCGIPAALMLKSRKKGFIVGYGMIARGEIAFVTIGIGLINDLFTNEIYSTLVFVIIATIFISPILLRRSYHNLQKEEALKD